ncbi:MAG: tRNA (cytosine(32)/uridine(32)-2'-O)-methyltransferase TrmJ, partial [Gammaproteobacteria bacterium]
MNSHSIENIRVVMVETTHPGNIGAAARAMKTMGYNNLYLVKPKIYPNAEATARAAGADDILSRVVVCDS